ncbi:hypothetical protein GW932_05110 [archaeon]|nr:hypothetical protein [archaeon]
MVNTDLVNYVYSALSQNVSIEKIKEELKKSGWNEFEINEAITFANKSYTGGSNTSYYSMVKKVIFIFFILAIIGLVLAYFFIFSSEKLNLTQDKLDSNFSYKMKKDRLEINYFGKESLLLLKSVKENEVNFELNSIEETLVVGRPRPFDLNFDNVKDTVILLKEVIQGKPYFEFSNYTTCIEEWVCTDWSSCVESKKTRSCQDTNSCLTNVTKPILQISCTGFMNLPL